MTDTARGREDATTYAGLAGQAVPDATEDAVFDVFLSHNGADKPAVEHIAHRLRSAASIEPWLDKWRLSPGGDWQEGLAKGLRASKACAVFVGPHGLGNWAPFELAVAQDRAAKDPAFRLFLVLLPGAVDVFDPRLDFIRARSQYVDLRAGISQTEAFQDLVAAITGLPRGAGSAVAEPGDVCPYRGLEVFDEDHAAFFVGREEDARLVLEKLRSTRFLAVVGDSGSGKSSLLRAGVVPALRRGALAGAEVCRVSVFTPGAEPLEALAAQVLRLFPGESMQATLARMRADQASLHLAAKLALADRAPHERLVLVVDQFEETFTLCGDGEERTSFLDNLCYAATIPEGSVIVVIAVRADFYPSCATHPQLRDLVANRQFYVGPLGADALRRVIEEPARRVGLELEAGLTETILADVGDGRGRLPLVEYVLLELWKRRRDRMLTLEGYVAAGRVEGALAKRANAVYDALTPAQQAIARRVLLRLIQPGEGSEDTRRRANERELVTRGDEQEDLEAVLSALARHRLVTVSVEDAHAGPENGEPRPLTGERVVDVAHEALIRGWPELRRWISEDRDAIRALRRLTEAAEEWEEGGRDDALLYRGARLLFWAERDAGELNELEREFLAASREREARERAAGRRRVRLTIAGLSAALVVISAAAIIALQQRDEAARQRDVALSRQLAANSEAQLGIDPERALALAVRSFDVHRTEAAEQSVREAIARSRLRATLRGGGGRMWAVNFSPDARFLAGAGVGGVRIWETTGGRARVVLRGQGPSTSDAVFSPDGRFVAAAGSDGTVRVWDWRSEAQRAELRGHDGAVFGVAFSPDGRLVASSGSDGTVRVWDWRRQVATATLSGHEGAVNAVNFSLDGRRAVSAGTDGTVRLWDLASDVGATVLGGHQGAVWDAVFSHDGRLVASAGVDDRTVLLWDATAGADPVARHNAVGSVSGVAFSPDDRLVVSSGQDGGVTAWDWGRKSEVFVLRGHAGAANDAAFSADGRRIASAGNDGTVRVWDPAAGADPVVLRGHEGAVYAVAFSADGRRVASAADGQVRIWDRSSGATALVLQGHQGAVYDVDFSPDGRLVASAGYGDATVRVWDAVEGKDPLFQRPHDGALYSVAFSSDGRLVLTSGDDGTVRIWDHRTGSPPVELAGHGSPVFDANFSPDGRRVVSAGDGTVRLWTRDAAAPPTRLDGHDDKVWTAVFSPDGQRVVTGGFDGTVREWRATGVPLRVLRGHEGPVYGAAVSPEGRWMASAGADGTVRVWDRQAPDRPVVLQGHEGGVYGVRFSRDGRSLVSAGQDGTVRIWRCEVCAPVTDLVRLARLRLALGQGGAGGG